MNYELPATAVPGQRVIVGMSGGVDSSVAALLLQRAGLIVEGLHMTNWEADDEYCSAAEDLQDARRTAAALGITLHHINFAAEYRQRVFDYFLDEYRRGRTPNPDVLCNRVIKFGVFAEYATRLGADWIATGHYARVQHREDGRGALLKGRDADKDQSYFLHAVDGRAFARTLFPLGNLEKPDVRRLASDAGLPTHRKKDSTGICFIGERPFREFLARFLPARPGTIETATGEAIGEHSGLMYYTPGQRQGLGIGGRREAGEAPWYVAGKDLARNVLVVVQGSDHPALYHDTLRCDSCHWINEPPAGLADGARLHARIRYRQRDQACVVRDTGAGGIELLFDAPQRGVATGQYAVLYDGERCLGGGAIDAVARGDALATALDSAVGA